MSTIIMYVAAFIIALVILDRIPGLKHLIKPVIDLVTLIFGGVFANLGSWAMWALKTLARSHQVLGLHLIKSRDVLDPTEKILRLNQRGGVEEKE